MVSLFYSFFLHIQNIVVISLVTLIKILDVSFPPPLPSPANDCIKMLQLLFVPHTSQFTSFYLTLGTHAVAKVLLNKLRSKYGVIILSKGTFMVY
jgi:hypothetical protein